MSKGQIIGFNDVIFNRKHTTQVRCISEVGTVFMIQKDEFIKKMQANKYSWEILTINAQDRDKETIAKIKANRNGKQEPKLDDQNSS